MVEDLSKEGRAVKRVHLKVRFAPFFTSHRIRKLPEPTYELEVIAQTALALFDRARRRPAGAAARGPG